MKKGLLRKCTMLLLAISLVLPHSSIAFAESSRTVKADDHLVAHYSFDGDLTNSVKDGVEATETGDRIDNTDGQITFVDGIVGQAAKFDGESGVRLPDGLISSDTYSVSLWLNPEEVTDYTTTFFGAAKTPDKWMSLVLKSWDDQTRLWAMNEEAYYDDAKFDLNIELNEWTHIAFTVSEGDFVSYVNGEKVTNTEGFPDIFTSEDTEFGLGINYWDTPFKGLMDELFIYDGKALTADEVKDFYNAGLDIEVEEDDSSVTHYSFDSDLADSTGDGFGTVTGDQIDNTGGQITYVDGVVGQAAKFDGESGIRLPDGLISSNQYSVSLWLNPDEITPFTTTFFGAATVDSWLSLVPSGPVNNETMIWSGSDLGTGWYDANTGMTISEREWTHIAFTVHEGKIDLYVNGVNEFSGTGFPNIFSETDASFGLGVNYWDTPYKGLMDELFIYDGKTLSSEEIKNIYEEVAFSTIDIKALTELIDKAKTITNDGKYTEESFTVLTDAIGAAEAILDEDNIELAEIKHAASQLQTAMNSLVGTGPEFKNVSVHDPSIIKKDGMYYVFGTHIDAAKSSDLIHWERFTNGYTTPGNVIYGDLSENLAESFKWAGEDDVDSKGGFSVWAPEAIWNKDYVNEDGSKGAYMMYYSASSTYIRSAIGYAVSQSIEGPYEYVDTIVYSGFTKEEAYDADSQVNKQWENTNIKGLVDRGKLAGAREGWFSSNGSYNNQLFPNAIDANLFHDDQGRLWMTYGSWSGGIFILEIDPETGAPIYPGEDGTTTDGRLIDRYFGTKISGGYGKSGEGPYVAYDEKSGYYFLNVTYGWLGADGGYQMRQFRAENPTGPYVDIKGQDAVLPGTSADHADYGNKLIGNFLFERKAGDLGTGIGYGYLSAGHNSVYIDPDTNEQFLAFHTRFPERGEQHELRIHQMFMNEDNWPVVAPYRYSGETLDKVSRDNLIGEYQFINHGSSISGETKDIIKATTISLNSDGTISGSVIGTWKHTDDYHATLTIDDHTYKGVFINQWNSITESKGITFTGLSDQGESIWGIQSVDRTDEEILEIMKNELTIGDTSGVINNIILPTEGIGGAKISWATSNPIVVTEEGVVNRPEIGEDNETVTLTATITKGDLTETKTFTVVVLANKFSGLVAHYGFDENLEEQTAKADPGTITGDRFDNTGGTITYESGVHGQAAVFDGSSGIRLPNGLITSNSYSISMWLNPEEFNNYTSAFFGATAEDNWISFTPRGHDDNDNDTMLWSGENWYLAGTEMKIEADEWTHIAFTVDEGKLDLYINGVNKFSGTGFPNVFTESDASFGLGVNYWDIPYKGLMDELLIYDNFVLSEQEIKEYYDSVEIPESGEQKVDVTALEELIGQAKGIENKNYTESSYLALQKAIETAELALSTIDSEIDLDDAIDTLQKAIDGLKDQIIEKDKVITKPIIKEKQVTISSKDIDRLAEDGQLIIDVKGIDGVEEKDIEEIYFTVDQVNTLKDKNAKIEIKKSRINLSIPANLLNHNENVAIKIEELSSDDLELKGIKAISNIFDLTITQDGLINEFGDRNPVTIKFTVDASKVKDTDNLRIYYLDEKINEWIEIGGRYEDGFVISDTTHFSKFIVMELFSEEDEPIEIDKIDLEKLIEQAKSFKGSIYTESSYLALKNAIEVAELALSTIDSDEKLAEAIGALQKAIEGLKEEDTKDDNPVVIDLTALADLIVQAKEIDNNNKYTETSYQSLKSAIEAAELALDTIDSEQELEDVINALQKAINELKEQVVDEQDEYIEDQDNSNKNKDDDVEIVDDEGESLPKTATSMYTVLLTGFIFLIMGMVIFYIIKTRKVKE